MHTVIENHDARFQEHWKTLYCNDPWQNPLYFSEGDAQILPASAGNPGNYRDRSFLVVSNDQPVFGCSMTLHIDDQGKKRLGYFGMEASTHVNRASMMNPSNNFQPEAIRLLQQHIDSILMEENPSFIEYLDPVSCGIMSPVTQVLLEKGGRPTVQQVQVIDLKQSERALYRQICRPYREAIRWGKKNLSLDIVSGESAASEQFLAQHASMLERSVALKNYIKLVRWGQGFLVQCRYEGETVASALFVNSNKTCQFVNGDLRDSSLPEPVIHTLFWQGIVVGKYLNCDQFDLGYSATGLMSQVDDDLTPEQFGGTSHTRLRVSLTQ